jgi:hypothetical protein
MNDALESLNLTQRSQSNANEMSWDERGCFGSPQCAHKNVKSLRERAKSRPPSIYRCTPSNRAIGQISWATDASVAPPTDAVPAFIAPPSATCPHAFKLQRSRANPTDASITSLPGRLSHRQTQSRELPRLDITRQMHLTRRRLTRLGVCHHYAKEDADASVDRR